MGGEPIQGRTVIRTSSPGGSPIPPPPARCTRVSPKGNPQGHPREPQPLAHPPLCSPSGQGQRYLCRVALGYFMFLHSLWKGCLVQNAMRSAVRFLPMLAALSCTKNPQTAIVRNLMAHCKPTAVRLSKIYSLTVSVAHHVCFNRPNVMHATA